MFCAKNYVGTPFLNLHVQGFLLTAALSRSTFRTPDKVIYQGTSTAGIDDQWCYLQYYS